MNRLPARIAGACGTWRCSGCAATLQTSMWLRWGVASCAEGAEGGGGWGVPTVEGPLLCRLRCGSGGGGRAAAPTARPCRACGARAARGMGIRSRPAAATFRPISPSHRPAAPASVCSAAHSPQVEGLDGGAAPWVAFGKHLCGAATDFTLRSCARELQRRRLPAAAGAAAQQAAAPAGQPSGGAVQRVPAGGGVRGLAVATCCHHRCSWQHFVAKQEMAELGFSPLEFEDIAWLTGGREGQEPPPPPLLRCRWCCCSCRYCCCKGGAGSSRSSVLCRGAAWLRCVTNLPLLPPPLPPSRRLGAVWA